MLDRFPIHPTLPAADLDRARDWYAEKLGLTPVRQEDVGLWYEFAGRTLLVYPSGSAGTAQSTAAEWIVESIESVMEELRDRGVAFEEYDFPGLKTESGLAAIGAWKAAWFKDSEGNILSITEQVPPAS
jgi:catechol 2,3-dioxygenase-like lactoylglutathione lyase family enzyme